MNNTKKSLDAVVEANRELLLQRSTVGIQKYGVTLAGSNLTRTQLTCHALEEALDLANYLQAVLLTPAPVDPRVADLVVLVNRLSAAVLRYDFGNVIVSQARDYLNRKGLNAVPRRVDVNVEFDSITRTDVANVWRFVTPDDRVHFRYDDETGTFCEEQYETVQECAAALAEYIKNL